jgi:dTDP-4-amino-4,6-dideoxygalactose transaminase
MIGFNFRMTEVEAAIGREQLKKLMNFTKKRGQNAAYFSQNLSKIAGITTPFVPEGFVHVYHQYTIKVERPYPLSRDQLLEKLHKNSIGARIYYPKLLNDEKVYASFKHKRLSVAEKIHKNILSLPVHPLLTKKDLDKIIGVVTNAQN